MHTKLKHSQAGLLKEATVMGDVTSGDVLRKIRVDQGKTVKQFCTKIGISENTLLSWELDKTSPKFDLFCAILDRYGYEVLVRKKVEK